MATVQLRPGDTLNLLVGNPHKVKGVECQIVAPFLYEDLLAILVSRPSRKNGSSPGGKVSRQINLFCQALAKGVWTTGAPVNRTDIARKLTELLTDLTSQGVYSLTPKAKQSLANVWDADFHLGGDLTTALNAVSQMMKQP